MNQTPIPWPTPTIEPLPVPQGTPVLNFGTGMSYEFAEDLVQGYHRANQLGALDIFMFVLILLLVLGGVWTVIQRLQAID